MPEIVRGAALALALFSLPSCGTPAQDAGRRADRTARQAAEQTAAEVDEGARLGVAEQRIARLERQVAELQAAPTAVDNELLKQRLDATETALYARSRTAIDQPAPTPTPLPVPSAAPPRPRAAATARPQPAPSASPRLQLVDPKLFDPRNADQKP